MKKNAAKQASHLAEIDLGAIEHNYRVICEAAKAPVLCVVKADCYGHGAVPVAKPPAKHGRAVFRGRDRAGGS